jgi:hypothetical protein
LNLFDQKYKDDCKGKLKGSLPAEVDDETKRSLLRSCLKHDNFEISSLGNCESQGSIVGYKDVQFANARIQWNCSNDYGIYNIYRKRTMSLLDGGGLGGVGLE